MQSNPVSQIFVLPLGKLEPCHLQGPSAPADLIGLPYRLGADPFKHRATDCVNLCRAALKLQGVDSPIPTRDWYRRLRRGDSEVFLEQLALWGVPALYASAGVVALSRVGKGYGLAAFYDGGWLHCNAQTVRVEWSPAVNIEALYSPGKNS